MPRSPFPALLLALAACTSAPSSDVAPTDATTDTALAPTCESRCTDLASHCAGYDAMACRTACASGAAGMSVSDTRACLTTTDLTCDGAAACLVNPFRSGPYGTHTRDVAAPFMLETTDGPWSFRDHWTGGDSYVFLVVTNTAYSQQLYGGSLADLLAVSPPDVHYFFLHQGAAPRLETFRQGALQDLASLSADDQAHWRSRVHFVADDLGARTDWLGDMVRQRRALATPYKLYEAVQWAIDRTQHLREVGQLGTLASSGLATDLTYAAHEPKYYDFEWARDQRLATEHATVVPLITQQTVHDTAYPEAVLPDAAALAAFDTLEVDLSLECANHRDGDCGAWDYLSYLWVCDAPSDATDAGVAMDDAGAGTGGGGMDAGMPPPTCTQEIARWITSYWREGRWVTDISGMLPMLREGGRKQFKWFASGQWDPRATDYNVSLALRFSNQHRAVRPSEAHLVYTGGSLNADYAASHAPQTFTVPDGVRKVELYTLVTGHGSQTRQCGEFCNHTHHFSVNGHEHVIAFPEAQSATGCADRVDQGVVPNQDGTWYFGRGGWCPGWDVRPVVQDVTADLVASGGANALTYRALIGSAAPAPGASYGDIVLSTYLVYSR